MVLQVAGTPPFGTWDVGDFVLNAPVGMHEVGPDHRILWANMAELDLLGYSEAEYVGHRMSEFFVDQDDFQSLLLRLQDRQSVKQYEAQIRCRNGESRMISLSCNVHWNDGEIVGIRFVMRDISDLIRSERELRRRRAEIESLNERLRRSMSETHHRVKNNLQIIAALVDMQLMANDGLVPANELRRVEHHIHALAAIHDLLTIESRKDPAMESISVKATLEVLRPLLQEMVGERPVRFRLQDVRLPIRQETALALIVNELIGNAARFGRGPIDLTLAVSAEVVCLEVRDEGPGFPPGFDATEYLNTGLELVETVSHWDLQGETSYDNSPSGGARVTVMFPISST